MLAIASVGTREKIIYGWERDKKAGNWRPTAVQTAQNRLYGAARDRMSLKTGKVCIALITDLSDHSLGSLQLGESIHEE
ncbi:hypothetical protein [Rosistilla carotiformis]|uniref:hypothetical protein n=1 Tax=Rosistilla carotiformis TaxID=2528017 RepID=UPI0011A84258|nr:hypothetical protein [Rosistilla carotiformis]